MTTHAFSLRRFAPAALALAALVAGCDEARVTGAALESDDPNFNQGKRLRDEGKNEAALESFTKVILSRRSAPEAHLEAGNLCLDTSIKDPLAAIYHFREYVKQSPNLDSLHKDLAKQRIRAAEKEFLKDPSLPFRPAEGVSDDRVADLQQQVKELRAENDALKRQKTDLIAAAARPATVVVRPSDDMESFAPLSAAPATPVATPPAVVTPPVAAPSAAASRKYTVVSGDTLSRIARKVYGSPNRWTDIMNANKDKIPSASTRLRVGDELVIPK